ncbi:MAG TPA: hypothetical protein VMS54_01975 [Vicinamibacterales bacterium]|nr:hypothetical protein [Vicinamibacterales bacterium]
MWSALLITATLAQVAAASQVQATGQAPATAAPTPPSNGWLVIVAAPVYQPDGAVAAETVNLPAAGAGLVHVFARRSICDPAVAGAAEPADAGFGWRIASQIVSRSEKDLVVSIDWRRVWDAGRKISNGPSGSAQLTLHPGDRIPLDHIANSSPRADCRAVGLGLEVRLGRGELPRSPVPAALLPIGATPGGAKAVDAELWLLHTLPSGAEQVMHQKVRMERAGGKFSFAPATVPTPNGDVRVELTGSIDRFSSPTGGEYMVVSMTRLVTGVSLPEAGVSGTTGSIVPFVPSEVLSFEMPGAAVRGRGGARGGGGAVAAGGGGVIERRAVDPATAGAGGGGAVVMRSPTGAGQAAAGAQAGARGGAGGSMAAVAGGREAAATNAQVAALLAGHQFAIRMKVTQVN